MSELIGIVGESGTGKSTSVRTLDPKETVIISCIGKPLPIRGWKKNYTPFKGKEGNFFCSDISTKIIECMEHISGKRDDIKNIVIVNRSSPTKKNLASNILEGIVSGEGIGYDRKGADYCINRKYY